MPYKLRGDHPGCGGIAVVRSDTGALVKCHPDRGKALAHLRALYANTDAAVSPDLAAAVNAAFRPGEARDLHGQWTSTGLTAALKLPGAHLLDQPGPGHAIIAFGDPATARHVVTYVPGVGDDAGLAGEARRALATKRATDAQGHGDSAAILWQGYRRPGSIHEALTKGRAEDAAPGLARFLTHLRTINPHGHQTIVGHSYGSVVAGESARRNGLRPDDLVFVGSPGTSARNVAELGVPAAHVWAGAHPQDPIARLAPILSEDFHGSPASAGYGAQPFAAGTPGHQFPGLFHGAAHSSYWSAASQALPNIAAIAAGQYRKVTRSRPAPVVVASPAQAAALAAAAYYHPGATTVTSPLTTWPPGEFRRPGTRAAGPPVIPGGPLRVVIENHPGCPAHQPHGIVSGDGHLLACHATPEEARAIAEKLDLSGGGDSALAAFDPARHPRNDQGEWAAKTTLYHGTAAELEPGDYIEPGHGHGAWTFDMHGKQAATTSLRDAHGYATDAAKAKWFNDYKKGPLPPGWVYEVKPDGPVTRGSTPNEYRATRWRVVKPRVKAMWPGELNQAGIMSAAVTTAAGGGFDPLKHPRIEHGHGGGEFTRSPGGGGSHTGHLADGITDPPPSEALTMKGRFTLADAKPGDPLLTKVNAKLTRPLMGAGPNKGKVRRPAVPPYAESVARTSAAMTALIEQQGTLEEGKKWYPDEHAMNHRRALAYHVPITTAIGVEAATCPRVQWIINQRVTNELLDEVPKVGRTAEEIKRAHHFGGGVMSSFRDEGVDIILGTPVDKELGGTKRRNFYNNIMWPGQTDSVTVDTWMLQALKPLGLNDDQAMALGQQSQAGLADGIGKVIVADALRQAAARYKAQGTDITPDGVQAAAWIAIQKQLGLSDPSAHANPRDVGYMHAAAPPDPDDEGDVLDDDHWDAELLIQYLTWLAEKVPGGTDLGSPGSARLTGGLAADNPAAWPIVTADPRFGRLGMTTAQARQAARGPAAPQAATADGGPYTVRENHPSCPAGSPHATVHSGTGQVAGCHRTKDQAQDLALTLNFTDAAPVTPGAVMDVGAAAGTFREDLHPRKLHGPGGGRFVPKGQGGGGSRRPLGPPRPFTAPHPAPSPGRGGITAPPPAGQLISPASARAFAAGIAKDEADLQAAAAEKRISEEVHLQLKDAIAEIERTHAQLAESERQEAKTEEHRKTVRKLIHHMFALAAVVLVGWLNFKMGVPDVLAGVTTIAPLAVQEAADFAKRV